jgi:hypothetical protein
VRIEQPPYFVDIVQDNRIQPPMWHCIVQRQGSSSAITWFQEFSEETARKSAEAELQNLRHEDLVSSGQLPLRLDPDPSQAA